MLNLRRHFSSKINERDREQLLRCATDAVVQGLNPVRVYAIGSILSESFDQASDIDLVVVFLSAHEARNSWRHRSMIRRKVPCPLDVIVFDLEEFEKKKDIGGMAYVAFHEGRLVYSDSHRQVD